MLDGSVVEDHQAAVDHRGLLAAADLQDPVAAAATLYTELFAHHLRAAADHQDRAAAAARLFERAAAADLQDQAAAVARK